jgi:hypothetical protein
MHNGVEFTTFREHIGHRLSEMAALGGVSMLLIDIEMGLNVTRPDPIGSMIDEHVIPPPDSKSARGRDGGILSAGASGSSPAR